MPKKVFSEEQSSILIQSIWRGKHARQKYGIKQVPKEDLTQDKAFLVGNDPKIKRLGPYKEHKEKIALVGTSGLRSLSLISELSNKNNIPKLIIVDNSEKVILFWRKLRALVETYDYTDKAEFYLAFHDFLSQNRSLYRDIPSHAMSNMNIPDVEYENQNPELFMMDLVEKHGLSYVLSIIKHTSIIAQTWSDNTLFSVLKNIIELNGIEKIYAYPSNIQFTVDMLTALNVQSSMSLLNPVLSIVTDRCPHHGIPENVYLVPGNQNPLNVSYNPIDSANNNPEEVEKERLSENNGVQNLSVSPVGDEEQAYHQAFNQIASDINVVNAAIKPYLEKLLTQIELLKKNGEESTAELTKVLLATHDRLHDQLDVETYKNLAETVQGNTSPGMNLLGGIMIGVGAAIIAFGVIAAVFLGPMNLFTMGAGVLTTAAGFGFFSAGSREGLSKVMIDISEQQSLLTV